LWFAPILLHSPPLIAVSLIAGTLEKRCAAARSVLSPAKLEKAGKSQSYVQSWDDWSVPDDCKDPKMHLARRLLLSSRQKPWPYFMGGGTMGPLVL
jgi:hypothetical protein